MQKKKVVKKKKVEPKAAYRVRETHTGLVTAMLRDVDDCVVYRTITRDEAALLAIELLIACGSLSRAEVASHFRRKT